MTKGERQAGKAKASKRAQPIDITNWRQRSQSRAHERNRVTYVSRDLGEFQRARREEKGLKQRDVTLQFKLPDDTPHPVIWNVLAANDELPAGASSKKVLSVYSMTAKVTQRLEAAVQEVTFAGWLAWCRALGDNPILSLRALGYTDGDVSTEAALMADSRLDDEGKRLMLQMLKRLTS